jgi:hypothetical protein
MGFITAGASQMASLDEGVTADADSIVIPASSPKQKSTETGPTFIVPKTTGQAQVVVRAFDVPFDMPTWRAGPATHIRRIGPGGLHILCAVLRVQCCTVPYPTVQTVRARYPAASTVSHCTCTRSGQLSSAQRSAAQRSSAPRSTAKRDDDTCLGRDERPSAGIPASRPE